MLLLARGLWRRARLMTAAVSLADFGGWMNVEVVHAAPRPGLSFTECCDRTMVELPPFDRISAHPDQVTCGRLTATDERVLSGQPFAADHQNSEQLLFDMAVSVCGLSGPSVSLAAAYDSVQRAVSELVGPRDPREFWPAALLVQITARATELAGF